MSYATPSDFRTWFTQQRLDSYVPGEDTQTNALLQIALDAASGEMDAAFAMGGYETPLDTEAAGEQEVALEALLRRHCIPIAADHLRVSLDALPANLAAQAEASRLWLAQVAGLQGFRPDGSVGAVAFLASLPGLTRPA